MLVFAAITPHTPLLLPTIGKDNFVKLKKTTAACKQLEATLYASGVDTLIIITPHGPAPADAFVINFSPTYRANFAEFGDFATKEEYRGDTGLSHQLKERLETTQALQLTTVPELDYGCTVPLHYLTAHNKRLRILPVAACQLGVSEHVAFGAALADELFAQKRRFGIVASSELSHKLTKTSPNGYTPKAKRFDRTLINALESHDYANILNLTADDLTEVGAEECRAIFILLGILANHNYRAEILSYQFPFGVGHLTAQLHVM
jgi:aromatic ring-opening dioxygenase LigB subunit